MRLFTAIWPDPATGDVLVARAMQSLPAGVRPVAAHRFHLTLAFIGETPSRRVEIIEETLAGVDFLPFSLRLERTGWFDRQRVAWVGPAAVEPGLAELHAQVRNALAQTGVRIENREFRPHVTIARPCRAAPAPWSGPPIEWTVSVFSLCVSDDGDYRVIRSFPARDAP